MATERLFESPPIWTLCSAAEPDKPGRCRIGAQPGQGTGGSRGTHPEKGEKGHAGVQATSSNRTILTETRHGFVARTLQIHCALEIHQDWNISAAFFLEQS